MQICQIAKTKFLIISENDQTCTSLLQSGFSGDQIIHSKDANLSEEIQRLTGGYGADVIFSNKAVDNALLEECALNLPPCSRIILFGRRKDRSDTPNDLFNSSELSVSFFDVLDICHRKPKLAARYEIIRRGAEP